MTIAIGRSRYGRACVCAHEPAVDAALPSDVRLPIARWALFSAGSLPVVLTGAWLTAGALQPASYSPVRQTVSVMSGYGGAHRWIVTVALYVIGVAYFVTAAGFRMLGPLPCAGLVASGAAAIAVASFPVPTRGTSDPHLVATVAGAIALAVWPALAARPGSPVRAALGRTRSIAASAVSFGLLAWMVIETQDGTALGLAERMSSSLQICWPFVIAVVLSRGQRVLLQ